MHCKGGGGVFAGGTCIGEIGEQTAFRKQERREKIALIDFGKIV